jgi:FkbM family methyltransferase
VLDRLFVTAEVKLASMATRSRLLRERRRCRQHGWSIPSVRDVLKAPQQYELVLMCQRFLDRPGPTALIDVGANTGYWAERFLAYIPAAYLGFEPDPRAYAELERRFPKADLINAAAGANAGSVVVHMTQTSTYSTITEYRDFASLDAAPTGEIAVERVTLDERVKLIPNSRTILKIDVQGAEAEVLQGASHLLRSVDLLVLEAPLFPQTALTNDLGRLCEIVRPHGLAPLYFCRPGLDADRYNVPVEHDVVFGRLDGRGWERFLR